MHTRSGRSQPDRPRQDFPRCRGRVSGDARTSPPPTSGQAAELSDRRRERELAPCSRHLPRRFRGDAAETSALRAKRESARPRLGNRFSSAAVTRHPASRVGACVRERARACRLRRGDRHRKLRLRTWPLLVHIGSERTLAPVRQDRSFAGKGAPLQGREQRKGAEADAVHHCPKPVAAGASRLARAPA
jgi:hypothetical protein